MKSTVKELTPRAKESLLVIAQKAIKEGLSKKDAIKAMSKRLIELGLIEKSGSYNQMLAVCMAFYNMEKAKSEGKKPLEILPQYAAFKQATTIKLSDYGAFADLWEILIRLYCKPEWSIQYSDLHVKRSYEIDVTIRGKKCEIGTNGKTFSESTEENAMEGKFNYVVYAVLTDEEKQIIFNLVKHGEIKKALENVGNMAYCFEKNQFFNLLSEKCGRASMIQYKEKYGYYQVIYNASKHSAFLKMVENENIPCLANWLNK